MHIAVRAWQDGEYWRVEVTDNGEGFDDEVMRGLVDKLSAVRDGSFRPGKEGLSIGGMGLVNTYARLHYHFGPACKMTLENTDNGARVVIRAPLKGEERA